MTTGQSNEAEGLVVAAKPESEQRRRWGWAEMAGVVR